jgi:hypothetical protein
MTPLSYLLDALDARAYVSIINTTADEFVTKTRMPLYEFLANHGLVAKYRTYDVQSVDVSKTDGIPTVYIRIAKGFGG